MTQLVVVQPVVSVRAAAVIVAVGDDGLMLHAQMRRLRHAIFLRAKRVGAEQPLVEVQVLEHLGEELLPFRLVLRQHPISRAGTISPVTLV